MWRKSLRIEGKRHLPSTSRNSKTTKSKSEVGTKGVIIFKIESPMPIFLLKFNLRILTDKPSRVLHIKPIPTNWTLPKMSLQKIKNPKNLELQTAKQTCTKKQH